MSYRNATHSQRPARVQPVLRHKLRMVSALAVIWLVILACGGQTVSPSTGYTCPEGTSCFARDWTTNSSYRGYKINVTTGQVTCTADCYAGGANGRINNSVTLQDTVSTGFIRIGYETHVSGGTTQNWYFWDQRRPGIGYQVTWLGQVPATADGQWAVYDVHATGPGTYSVSLNQPLAGGGSTGYMQTSSNNSMSPNQIVFGQELVGHAGAAAAVVFFSHPQWYNGGGSLTDVTDYGTYSQQKPPYGNWIIDPSAVNNPPTVPNNDFYTECCLAPSLDITLG